ncbi:hypothetical protein DERP_004223 [Dermatophagoides pteronyssinus]|uniref:Uncharacterized protein n=1 Tax=Dermatophagoides pteronyssinus TaxID=6956 RepID=A0ABQ8J8J2_DERPT|nr:hypothetical protein DERP_004223 [Dermatophagoides pteronyssinus]
MSKRNSFPLDDSIKYLKIHKVITAVPHLTSVPRRNFFLNKQTQNILNKKKLIAYHQFYFENFYFLKNNNNNK